jgi:predicted pyridoxine 5'-phosphate oxidase superfamily flavin-nucleotide-binding protein
MVAFVQRMEMVFVASADAHGECDASLRAGPPGFIRVVDARTLAYPEYRGNGVHASLGNITENGHVGLLMVDFVHDLIGLHVNGVARIVEAEEFDVAFPLVPRDVEHGRRPERWVVVEVEEAYVHCRKHIPRMARVDQKREWGTDDPGRKGGDYFRVKQTPRWRPRPHVGRRRFPTTTHLGGGTARVLRPR